jgi:hypothetical protein
LKVYDALRLAVQHLESSGQWPDDPYRLTASRDDARWVFWFQLLPETPGRDVTVFVADDGEVSTLAGL